MSEEKQVKTVNPFEELIGAKLERVHCIPASVIGYKSITLNFDNDKSLCFEIKMIGAAPSPIIKMSKGTWEMIKAAPDEVEKAVEDMTAKELIETPASECRCLDCNLPSLGTTEDELVVEPLSEVAKKVQATTERPNSVAHVRFERIQNRSGCLAYSLENGNSEKIILESIKFTLGLYDPHVLVAWCDKDGNIFSDDVQPKRIEGFVNSAGAYSFSGVYGIDIATDDLCVSYDYAYNLPVVQE